jgi:hypothetical protein
MKDSFDKKSDVKLPIEDCSEIIVQINIQNYSTQFLDFYEQCSNLHNIKSFLTFKIDDECFTSKDKKELSDKIMSLFINIHKTSDFLSSKLKGDCLINNLSISKECRENLNKFGEEYLQCEEKLKKLNLIKVDKNLYYLMLIVENSILEFEAKTVRLEKSVNINSIYKL